MVYSSLLLILDRYDLRNMNEAENPGANVEANPTKTMEGVYD